MKPFDYQPAPAKTLGSSAELRFIDHKVASSDGFEGLAETGRLSMIFRATSRDVPQLDIQGFLAPSLSIWSLRSPTGFESVPICGRDVYSIRIPLQGRITRRTGRRELETTSGEATILAASDIVATRYDPGAEVLTCAIAASDLRERHEALGGSGTSPLSLDPRANFGPLPTRALVHTLRNIAAVSHSEADALTGPLLADLLMNQILMAWPSERLGATQDIAASGHPRALSRAIDYIEAHLGEPLTVSLVAAAAGVSVRTLQTIFHARTGRTPLGYILERRLECAHADLMASAGRFQVSQIAYRWGFVHMGEFARRYRLRFGCPPSHTNRHAP